MKGIGFLRIIVDRSCCVGAGQCAMLAGTLFAQDEADGLVVLLNDAPCLGDQAIAEAAELACPSRAIRLER